MAGHVFPVWLRFKGGKGVAVGGGAVIALMPLASVFLLALWLVVAVVSRYTSLASVTSAVVATPLVWLMGYPAADIVFTAVAAIAVLVLHRGNIERLARGTERRITLSGRRSPRGA